MRKIATIAGLVLAATSLGGCQSLFGSNTASADLNDVDMSSYFEQRLLEGRLHLNANRPTRAITAFRQGSYDPKYAAEAFNGMAIAYDRIGRPDLAARYFAKAVEADPRDERFARNLARFEEYAVMAMPTLPDAAPVELAVAEIQLPDVRGAVTIQPRPRELSGAVKLDRAAPVQVARVSQGQVAVGAAPTGAVHLADRGNAAAHITVASRQTSQRVAERVRRSAQARKGYPIRFVLRSDKASARP
ncbi:hypothetical protein EKN06_04180 [Croceicoccus ponticola]|uniref:Uncharacterized protein n=1 Tax=Croceicoccus ponticola TaxID=2217664 RepID=A0A437H158_9SPHN|nr:hypothetical protein [Croceicoccus ponticola]RVQ69387.1 hypothetical protein EKN06_04180 [Croceicoccus ponticola]